MCAVIICCLVCDIINFEIKHSFLIKRFFYITTKSGKKMQISQESKELLTLEKKNFINFKVLSLK